MSEFDESPGTEPGELDSPDAFEPSDGVELAEAHDAELATPPGWLARLWETLRHPFWIEDRDYRARRRCRSMIAMPFAAIAGLVWGLLASPTLAGSAALWGPFGSFAFVFFIYLEQRLLPPMAELVSKVWPGVGRLAGLAWETVVVGALFFLVTSVIGAPLIPAVGTALGLGAFYAVAMEYVLCGSAASDVALLLQGAASGSGARLKNPLSHADTLLHRGRTEAAVRIYREAIDYDSRDPTPYIKLSRVREGAQEYGAAVELLRSAFYQAKLKPDQEAYVVRRIYEISLGKLGDAALATEELEMLVERQKRSEHATWARWRLRELKEADEGSSTQ